MKFGTKAVHAGVKPDPVSMTHAAIPKIEREKTGVVDSLIRLSICVEDAEYLTADLGEALG